MEDSAEELCFSSGMAENSEETESSPVGYRRAQKEQEQPWKRSCVYLQCCEYQSSSLGLALHITTVTQNIYSVYRDHHLTLHGKRLTEAQTSHICK